MNDRVAKIGDNLRVFANAYATLLREVLKARVDYPLLKMPATCVVEGYADISPDRVVANVAASFLEANSRYRRGYSSSKDAMDSDMAFLDGEVISVLGLEVMRANSPEKLHNIKKIVADHTEWLVKEIAKQ